jgi:hypothetical protein
MSAKSTGYIAWVELIVDRIKSLVAQNYSGSWSITLFFNDGGIRSCKQHLESNLELKDVSKRSLDSP